MRVIYNFIGSLGKFSITGFYHLICVLSLFGRFIIRIPTIIIGKENISLRAIIYEIDSLGIDSLKFILLSFITVGISTIVLSFEQLESYGGLPVISYFFAKAILRELGPIIAGIVMSVKIGSKLTVRIASTPLSKRMSLRGNHPEFDLNSVFIPAMLAVLIVGPTLYVIGSFVGLFAGVISQSYGSTQNFFIFSRSILDYLALNDLEFGILKAYSFGVVIVLISSYIGFITPADNDSIREVTVTSIIICSLSVLVINAMFAYAFTLNLIISHFT